MKPASATAHPDRPGEYRFFGHEKLSVAQVDEITNRLRFSNARREQVRVLVATHMLHPNETWGDAALRRLLRKVGPERLDEFLMLKRADIRAKGTPDVASLIDDVDDIEARLRGEVARGAALSRRDLAVDGTELCALLGRQPGPWLRALFIDLLDWVTEDPGRNTREQLVVRAQQFDPD